MTRPNVEEFRKRAEYGKRLGIEVAADFLTVIDYVEHLEAERTIDRRVIAANVWLMNAIDIAFQVARSKAVGDIDADALGREYEASIEKHRSAAGDDQTQAPVSQDIESPTKEQTK